ncbi:aminotransferase A [Bacillus licheniformis]|jgi:aminotransferase|uniref:Aminotransferase n=2 Tax=Bacillus licheniformis TaxID=1402 RepID=Q65KA5_BACLD|nr:MULTISPECIES: aminotransferase A [Bacillus]MBY8346284.1 aminotransferase A [Bacillus sp. PCH94]MDP4081662.1 aminotransferase A [Bacillota bacterium]AAU23151.1 putative aspartate transaminase [Bacillus licheniformis DSM 13 = ATCC 14580]AAU40509.1 aromatic amino acid aminotransferase apoenzyme PatA [Bacillus licheniformis DSM 13 = ATCC 14580]AKQ72748.1 aminotransferase [Bacillus licheniformis WX-02]
MEHLLNPNVKEIEISGIRKFSNLVSQYENVISLTIGQPDFFTPHHVKQAAKKAIDENQTSYTHNAGYPELRQAVQLYMKKKADLNYEAESEIIVTTGASQAIDSAFRTILSPGDEVILPGPVYPGYEPIIKMCGASPLIIDTTSHGFKLTAKLIEEALTPKTKCVVLPYPSNPTGMTLSEEELKDIASLLKGRNVFVLSDEIYSELTFDRPHHSIATVLRDQTIVIGGLSKSHSMTGWRIGFLFAPKEIAKHILKVHQYNVSCASSISQKAALEAVTNGFDDALIMREQYKKRLDYVYDRLVTMGLDVIKPSGAFYIFPSIKSFGMSSFDFCMSLLEEEGLAIVPGSSFSEYGEGYVRISYAYSPDTLREGLDRLESFVFNKRQSIQTT